MKTIQKIFLFLIIGGLIFSILPPSSSSAEKPENAPYSHSFEGRRGISYTASWVPTSYEVSITTLDGTFPWDWISFVGRRGAVALAGHQGAADTLAFSGSNPLEGLQLGDIMRVKAWDQINLSHLTKIGLVIGSVLTYSTRCLVCKLQESLDLILSISCLTSF